MGEFSDKHYLVTGGCGFIGGHLSHALIAAGHRVTILDNFSTGRREAAPANATILKGDITDSKIVAHAMQNIDGCFHLAAIASVAKATEDWVGCHRANLTGSINIFDAARAGKIPVVYASSAAVYGANSDLPLNEKSSTAPLSAYGADKLACELHARVARGIFNVPTLGLRLFNVYGPGQSPDSMYSGVISIFITKALADQPLALHGDGSQTRDFIHVGDVVAHFIAAMELLHGNSPDRSAVLPIALNVCTGRMVTIREIADQVIKASGKNSKLIPLPPREGDIPASLGDPALTIKTLGIQAICDLQTGLAETVTAIRAGN